jgi:hypothetical protein
VSRASSTCPARLYGANVCLPSCRQLQPTASTCLACRRESRANCAVRKNPGSGPRGPDYQRQNNRQQTTNSRRRVQRGARLCARLFYADCGDVAPACEHPAEDPVLQLGSAACNGSNRQHEHSPDSQTTVLSAATRLTVLDGAIEGCTLARTSEGKGNQQKVARSIGSRVQVRGWNVWWTDPDGSMFYVPCSIHLQYQSYERHGCYIQARPPESCSIANDCLRRRQQNGQWPASQWEDDNGGRVGASPLPRGGRR